MNTPNIEKEELVNNDKEDDQQMNLEEQINETVEQIDASSEHETQSSEEVCFVFYELKF